VAPWRQELGDNDVDNRTARRALLNVESKHPNGAPRSHRQLDAHLEELGLAGDPEAIERAVAVGGFLRDDFPAAAPSPPAPPR